MKKFRVGDDVTTDICRGLQDALDSHYIFTRQLFESLKEECLEELWRRCSRQIIFEEYIDV